MQDIIILAQCRYTKTAQRIFKHNDVQYTSLTLDKKLNSLIYKTLFYVNIYESYKLLKIVCFLAHHVHVGSAHAARAPFFRLIIETRACLQVYYLYCVILRYLSKKRINLLRHKTMEYTSLREYDVCKLICINMVTSGLGYKFVVETI